MGLKVDFLETKTPKRLQTLPLPDHDKVGGGGGGGQTRDPTVVRTFANVQRLKLKRSSLLQVCNEGLAQQAEVSSWGYMLLHTYKDGYSHPKTKAHARGCRKQWPQHE